MCCCWSPEMPDCFIGAAQRTLARRFAEAEGGRCPGVSFTSDQGCSPSLSCFNWSRGFCRFRSVSWCFQFQGNPRLEVHRQGLLGPIPRRWACGALKAVGGDTGLAEDSERYFHAGGNSSAPASWMRNYSCANMKLTCHQRVWKHRHTLCFLFTLP